MKFKCVALQSITKTVIIDAQSTVEAHDIAETLDISDYTTEILTEWKLLDIITIREPVIEKALDIMTRLGRTAYNMGRDDGLTNSKTNADDIGDAYIKAYYESGYDIGIREFFAMETT